MTRLIKYLIYILIFLTISLFIFELLNRKMLLTISLIIQLLIIYKLLFVKKVQFWRITSQFAFMILFFNILPYLVLKDDIYFDHFILIFVSQIFISYYFIYKYQINWEFEKLHSYKIKKNEKIFIFAIFAICLSLQFDLPVSFVFSHEIVLSLLIFLTIYLTEKKNNLIIISILGSLIIYQLYLNGIISGDRRFVIVFGLLFYFYSKFFFNFDIKNEFFIFIIPFIFIIFFLIGLYRIGSLNLNFVTVLVNLDFSNLLKNIDIGMYSKVYQNFFNDHPDMLISIKSKYLTGISYEKIFYFFIDRSYWPEKPVLIANYLSKNIGGGATTLAPGLILDIYINFYHFSPLALFFVMKYIMFLEKKFVTGKDFYNYFYFFNCCIFIIIARGSFEISILFYYIFFIISFYLSAKVAKILKN